MKYVYAALFSLVVFLSGCATISGVGKDNTPAPAPLITFTPQLHPQKNWSVQAGKGTDGKAIHLSPAVSDNMFFTADYKGNITALNLQNGQKLWQVNMKTPLVAGIGTGEGVILAGSSQADLYALNQASGKMLWHIKLSNQITAPPVSAGNTVIVNTLDGQLWAINLSNGQTLWQQAYSVPFMVLAGGSRPRIVGDTIICATPNGKLAAYTLSQGKLRWQTEISLPQGASDVEQMVDIVAGTQVSPSGNTLYVAAYQGNLAAVNTNTGQILWQQPLSSYTDVALSDQSLFVTDTHGIIRAFNRHTGTLLWAQTALQYRKLSAPVVIGNAIVVGDGEGYAHWLSQANGTLLARVMVNKNTPIVDTPVVIGNHIYILDADGLVSHFS